MKDTEDLKKIATQIRRDILRMTHAAQSGHPGGSLGCTDFMATLFFNFLRNDPEKFDMNGLDEDIFILSNGHISPVLYSTMARKGYFPVSELSTFRTLNTRLQGHPTPAEGLPGIRIATGSLGQGLSVSIGAALSKKLNHDNHFVYCLMGDGELQEGQNWEAFMFAAHHKVDNLIAVIDRNNKQIDGPVSIVLDLGDLREKLLNFGWAVLEMDGHDINDIQLKIREAHSLSGKQKPVCLVMKTIMGKGVDFMEDDHKWHGVAPGDNDLSEALKQLEPTLGDF